MRLTHNCVASPVFDRLPRNATMATFTWKCPVCKQKWYITQTQAIVSGHRIGLRRKWKVKS